MALEKYQYIFYAKDRRNEAIVHLNCGTVQPSASIVTSASGGYVQLKNVEDIVTVLSVMQYMHCTSVCSVYRFGIYCVHFICTMFRALFEYCMISVYCVVNVMCSSGSESKLLSQ